MNKKLVSAIFLDRDGTINVHNGYIGEIYNFKFIAGVINAMRALKKMGYTLVIITNQSGIARGKFTEIQLKNLNKWIIWYLAKKNIKIDNIYYCPHHPQGYIKKYRKICNCRKPHTGMLKSAQMDLHIDMSASFMVGDTREDMQAAIKAGIGTKILVHTGKPITEEAKKLADYTIYSLAILPKKITELRKQYNDLILDIKDNFSFL